MTNYFDASVELVVANHWNIQLRNGTPAGSIAKVRVSRNWTLTHFPHECKKYPQIWHGLADMCVDMSITLQPLVSSDPLQPRYSWSRYLYINQWHIGVYRCLLNLFGARRKSNLLPSPKQARSSSRHFQYYSSIGWPKLVGHSDNHFFAFYCDGSSCLCFFFQRKICMYSFTFLLKCCVELLLCRQQEYWMPFFCRGIFFFRLGKRCCNIYL